jgi:signal transduction histidine kinase
MSSRPNRVAPRLVTAYHVGLLAVLYVGLARLGLMIDAVGGFATLVWPGSGLALVALLRLGRHVWPGVALGAFLVNAWTGAPLPVACGIAAGNTLEAVAGAWLLNTLNFDSSLRRVSDALLLIGVAALFSTMLSATIGVGSLHLGGILPLSEAPATWRAWWLGDVIGDLVLAPLMLCWSSPSPQLCESWPRKLEAIALGLCTIGLGLLLFDGPSTAGMASFRRPHMVFPLLVWGALRFDQRGATSVTFACAALAIYGALRGHGPFLQPRLNESLVYLQTFMANAAVTGLFMGAAIASWRRAVSDREAAERQARDAISVRDEFMSIASHELRTPLSALVLLLGSLQRVARDDNTAASPKLVEKAARAVRVGERLARLVDSLLDVSRLAKGTLDLRREDCDLAQIASETAERFQVEAQRAGCKLTTHAGGPVPGHWDALRLEQVVTNLLSNAIKYGAGAPIELRVFSNHASASFSVEDHGIGIAEQDQSRIFVRFERAVPVRNYGGLGLGLYIARQIVEAHGGTIGLQSSLGQGSRFTVSLPCSRN